jgi:SAM-dependent methyltransferase
VTYWSHVNACPSRDDAPVTEPADVVREGYDRIAEAYLAGSRGGRVRRRFLDETLVRLPAGARVLDLGCGAGQPVAEALAREHDVLGIDLSPRQIELARQAVPAARFEVGDLTTLEVEPRSFDAVVSFYALGHVPGREHARFFRRVADWLRPGGFLLTSAPQGVEDQVTPDWLGVPMYFGGIGVEATLAAVTAAGLRTEVAEVVPEGEDEPGVSFLWVIASRPAEEGPL